MARSHSGPQWGSQSGSRAWARRQHAAERGPASKGEREPCDQSLAEPPRLAVGSGAGHLTSAQLLVLERKSGWRPADAGGIANEGRSITVQPRSPWQAGWMGAVCATHTHVRVHTFMPMYTCADRHTQIHRHTLTQVYTQTYRCKRALRHVNIHTVTQTCLHTDAHAHSHTGTHSHKCMLVTQAGHTLLCVYGWDSQ